MAQKTPCTVRSTETTVPHSVWRIKRYGRFLPGAKDSGGNSSWKVFESNETMGHLELTILESGHLLVSRAQELLEGFSLLNAQSFLKIQRKSDNLLFHITVKGESRLIRLQFDGSSRAEAMEVCSRAVERLQDYLPVGTQENAATTPSPPPPPPPPPAPPAPHPSTQPLPGPATSPHTQQQHVEEASAVPPDSLTRSMSLQQLTQHFLGECTLSLPLAYQHSTLPSGDLEALLRLCLLDSGFPAFVEVVEKELKKLSED